MRIKTTLLTGRRIARFCYRIAIKTVISIFVIFVIIPLSLKGQGFYGATNTWWFGVASGTNINFY